MPENDDAQVCPEELARRTQQFVEYVVEVEHNSVHASYQPGVWYACPCCRCKTLTERGFYDICPVCFWEDDGQDAGSADMVRGGPNGSLSLTQGRANYKEFGACKREMLSHVRPPRPEEMPDEPAESEEGGVYACPCCGYLTLETSDEYKICDVCYWEDNGQGDEDADMVRGDDNGDLSLTQARANYKAFGACSQGCLKYVRPPNPKEVPDSMR